MLRFTIRELLLLTLVAALAIGWWLDHRQLSHTAAESQMLQKWSELNLAHARIELEMTKQKLVTKTRP